MQDYKKLGFRAGLEIHRQMSTHKLFCSCPSLLSEKVDATIKRELRPVVSELGEKDIVANYELGKNKYAIYEITNESSCLLEIDEEPAGKINQEAFDTSLIVARMLNCKIVDEIEFMRKQVLDYSNTSGFQRTALIAINGYIETSKGKVGIQSICLEEDAARKIKDEKEYIVYRLDRLGTPLIEIATDANIKDPEHVKEVAEYLGMILKSTGRFKSGLGTIRQDINISIEGHPRVEIKGFQDLKSIPRVVEYEINRQLKLVEIHNRIRKIKDYNVESLNLTKIFKNTNCKIIKNVLDNNGSIFGARLAGFNGILAIEFGENKRFGTELSYYAKIHGVGGIIHSDEDLRKYNLSDSEISEIKDNLKIKENDAFILIADQEEKARKAINSAIIRANAQYNADFPKEVRKAELDFTTSFLRPMPGSSRMYVETDVPRIKITEELLTKIKLPELISKKIDSLEELYGLNPDIARELIKKEINFEEFLNLYRNLDANTIARIILEVPKELKTRFNLEIFNLKDEDRECYLHTVLCLLNENKINKDTQEM